MSQHVLLCGYLCSFRFWCYIELRSVCAKSNAVCHMASLKDSGSMPRKTAAAIPTIVSRRMRFASATSLVRRMSRCFPRMRRGYQVCRFLFLRGSWWFPLCRVLLVLTVSLGFGGL